MKNILVTGGCGFIGSNFINHFCEKYPECFVYNIDCLNYCASTSNVKPHSNYKFIEGNITDKSFVAFILKEFQIDTIIHFAAQSHVDNSFDNSLQYTIDNVFGTHVLLDSSKRYGKIEKFIHFSTDEVYGEVSLDHEGCSESHLLNPTNPYAATKAAAEDLVNSYGHSFKLPYVIIRCNNVYGPNQYEEKLIPRFAKLLLEGKKCTIHGKGQTRRNFIHTFDVFNAVDVILHSDILNTTVNIGTKNEYSVMDITKMLVKLVYDTDDITPYIEYVGDRPFNDSRYAIKSDRLIGLGWKEQIPFEQGFRETFEHYKQKWGKS